MNAPSNVPSDNVELLVTFVDASFESVPDALNGFAFDDESSLVVIDEFGIVSKELEEILNAP